MKKGYLKRNEELFQEIERMKREKGAHLIELKQKLAKETETKNLLLKKLSVFIE